MRALRTVLLAFVGVVFAGCSDDGATGPKISSFAAFQQVLQNDCAACHSSYGAYLNLLNTFQTTMDSASLVESGFINPSDPSRSLLILKARNSTPHGGGRVESFSADDERRLSDWIRKQQSLFAYDLTAARIDQSLAPVVNGEATDPGWATATATTFPINGDGLMRVR